MRAAVLGCNGSMGSYFVDLLLQGGYGVVGSDIRRRPSSKRLNFTTSNAAAAKGSDLVIVAVPIRSTVAVVREIASLLKQGSVLVEMTSVKTHVLPELESIMKGSGATLLSVHPLFGPATAGRRPKMCVVGGTDAMKAARRIFPGMKLIQFTLEHHDREMAYALTLVHLTNMVFVAAITRGPGIARFRRSSTPSGEKQLDLARSVLSQDPSLYSYIETENPYAAEALDAAFASFTELRAAMLKKDSEKFEREFSALGKILRVG